jgi:hypothetical protein
MVLTTMINAVTTALHLHASSASRSRTYTYRRTTTWRIRVGERLRRGKRKKFSQGASERARTWALVPCAAHHLLQSTPADGWERDGEKNQTKEEQLGCPRASPTRRKAGQSTEAGTNPTVIAKAESDDPAGNVTKEPQLAGGAGRGRSASHQAGHQTIMWALR